ncbi:3744_t:CDS:2 [Ambispora gerdemannii]|uniref:Acetyltransferase component of pyruvate dehydrogenase complex n=1 Tax=Ambispora gerdemannii TaxID=144530 RepID=A0A9N9F251_9GLOM|nr:3744_t:CDS:2 [Ambispora gerdemannii]
MLALRNSTRTLLPKFSRERVNRLALGPVLVSTSTRRFLPSIKNDVSTCCSPRTRFVWTFGGGGGARNTSIKKYAGRRYYASSYPPHIDILMPALSPTMTMGNVGTWQKNIGDPVSPGDVLVDIETDKAQMDFECQEEGYLAKILVETGTKDVKVGQPIAVLVEGQEDVEKFTDYTIADTGIADTGSAQPTPKEEKPKEQSPEPQKNSDSTTTQPSTPSPQKKSSDRIFASPLARKLAEERGIPLDQITGTGPNDRIIKADVDSFVAPAPSSPEAEYTDIPLSNIRRVIAARLTESKQTVPHYYLTIEAEMDKVLKLREVLNKDSDGSYKLSVNDFIIKASALALKNVPEVNSAWHGEFVRQYHNSDISIATATPTGLITPIITKAESKGLAVISNQVKELASRAREGKLAPHEFQGGSFSISNLGMYSIKSFTAIINPPQSCILAVGTTTKKLVPDESQTTGYRVTNTIHVTLSCDHRVVDGAVGAQWLKAWRSYIENPLRFLL